ncbi:MAG: hypothetical protein ABEJ30_03380 [Halorientalis sp.]
MLDVRAGATRLREIAPGVEQKSLEQLAARVREGEDFEAEIVIPRSASEAASSRPEYREAHETTLRADCVDVYVHPGPIRFAAGVVDETAAVAVMRDEQPHALALSEGKGLRAWAETLFEEYRAASTPKTEL